MDLRDSSTYLATLDEGAVAEARKFILLQGRKRFGEPDDAAKALLASISNLEQLEGLGERLLDVSSWRELLQMP